MPAASMALRARATAGRTPNVACAALYAASYVLLLPGTTLAFCGIAETRLEKSLLALMSALLSEGFLGVFAVLLVGAVLVPTARLPVLACLAARPRVVHPAAITAVQLTSKWGMVVSFTAVVCVASRGMSPYYSMSVSYGFYCYTAHCLLAVAASHLLPDTPVRSLLLEEARGRAPAGIGLSGILLLTGAGWALGFLSFFFSKDLLAFATPADMEYRYGLAAELAMLQADRDVATATVWELLSGLGDRGNLVSFSLLSLLVVMAPLADFVAAAARGLGFGLDVRVCHCIEDLAMLDTFAFGLQLGPFVSSLLDERFRMHLLHPCYGLLGVTMWWSASSWYSRFRLDVARPATRHGGPDAAKHARRERRDWAQHRVLATSSRSLPEVPEEELLATVRPAVERAFGPEFESMGAGAACGMPGGGAVRRRWALERCVEFGRDGGKSSFWLDFDSPDSAREALEQRSSIVQITRSRTGSGTRPIKWQLQQGRSGWTCGPALDKVKIAVIASGGRADDGPLGAAGPG